MKAQALVAAVLTLAATLTQVKAAHHEGDPSVKKGILLVTFGTSVPEAQPAFKNIDRLARARFPGADIHWAFTSRMIRKKLAARGEPVDSPTVALANMLEQGYTHVAVQSFHFIPGVEFHEVVRTAARFRGLGGFKQIDVGLPLLAGYDDVGRACATALSMAPAGRKPDEALVFMGHGSEHHGADLIYVATAAMLRERDALALLGTVEGHPTLDVVVAACKKANVKKAYLIPFMSVAGDHVRNDMAGDEDDSWKSVLTAQGIACEPVLTGMAECDTVVAIWLDHLDAVWKGLAAD